MEGQQNHRKLAHVRLARGEEKLIDPGSYPGEDER
jgi:hypothetical protein